MLVSELIDALGWVDEDAIDQPDNNISPNANQSFSTFPFLFPSKRLLPPGLSGSPNPLALGKATEVGNLTIPRFVYFFYF